LAIPELREVRVEDSVLRARLAGRADALVKAAARYPVASLVVEEPDLEELFFTYYGGEEATDAA
jgi:ABC-2 type transport system ATP-binding protein